MSIQDTIRRLRHVGNLIDLNENSSYVRLADALLSIDRARYEEAVKKSKKVLSDWAGNELDDFWGAALGVLRLPGVDQSEDFLGDASYVMRLNRFMEAANKGASLESVRQAAEAGAGVPFSVHNAAGRVVLNPLESITPAQREGAMNAARRIAPARAILEIGDAETFNSHAMSKAYSPSNYVGEHPDTGLLSGPSFDSDNYVITTTARNWDTAPEGSLQPGPGTPGDMFRDGAWHTSPLGFGDRVTLDVLANGDPINRVKFSVGPGTWIIEITANNETLHRERIISDSGWSIFDRVFEFAREETFQIHFTQDTQDVKDLFVRGFYMGARVTPETRLRWLKLGGLRGPGKENIVNGDAKNLEGGGEWISNPTSEPLSRIQLYRTLAAIPVRVEALYFKTRTPETLFTVEHAMGRVYKDEDYPLLEWKTLPGLYTMRNGRVKVSPFRAEHIRITFTALRPMLLKDFPAYGGY